jgi:hypothetical protein
MKNKKITLPAAIFVLTALLLLSGCSGLVDATMGVGSAIDKGKQKVSGAAERAVMDATGVSAMQDSVMASFVYSYAFFAGGYMAGYQDLSEGEGLTWRLTVTDEDGEESVTVERALLKRTAEGKQWWFLSYRSEDGEELLTEALLDNEYQIEIFRYQDPETDEIREWRPEQSDMEEGESTDGQDKAQEKSAEETPDFYAGSWQDHVIGTETVRVPAGTYTAEHARITVEYQADTGEASEENGDEADEGEAQELIYEWWISDEAPGKLVKYYWSGSSGELEFLGELIEHRTDYRSRLASF